MSSSIDCMVLYKTCLDACGVINPPENTILTPRTIKKQATIKSFDCSFYTNTFRLHCSNLYLNPPKSRKIPI